MRPYAALLGSDESIIAVGLALKRQKERLPHGMFLPWIEAEFEMSENTARNMMRVAEHYAGKSATVAVLNAKALYELAAPSTPQPIRDEVEALLVDGQKVTTADIRKMKADAKDAELMKRATRIRTAPFAEPGNCSSRSSRVKALGTVNGVWVPIPH